MVGIGGTHKKLYNVVWDTFCPDRPLAEDQTIDHIDQDHGNDFLYNLRSATMEQQMRNMSKTLPQNRRTIACANPDRCFFADAATFEAARSLVTEEADCVPTNRVQHRSKQETMDELVRCAKRVVAKDRDNDGPLARMPTASELGGTLWGHMKHRFHNHRGPEFAKRMGWTEERARAFIAECKSRRSQTRSAQQQRARKRKTAYDTDEDADPDFF